MNLTIESLLDEIEAWCNPMVARWKMRFLHEVIASSPEIRHAVEVGTGHGALTVLIDHALTSSGSDHRIVTFERIRDGSRAAYGSYEENARLIRANIDRFGASGRVRLVLEDVADAHEEVGRDRPIDLLVLDADGRIDRDLLLFWDRMSPTCLLVLDDADGDLTLDRPRLIPYLSRSFLADGKHWMTAHIVRRMIEDGLLVPVAAAGDLRILRRAGHGSRSITPEYFLGIYRTLIPTTARFPGRNVAVVLPSSRGIALLLIRRTSIGRALYRRFRGRR